MTYPLALLIAVCQYIDMVCLHCGSETQVINSRLQKRSNQVWRRRKCLTCGNVFTTEETINYDGTWMVRSKNGHLQPFSRDKLFLSLYHSCRHRQTAETDASGLTETVIKKLLARSSDGVIDSQMIVSTAQVVLSRFDRAAAVQYNAYHK